MLEFETRFLLEDLRGAPFGGIRDCERLLEAANAAWSRLQREEPGWPVDELDIAFDARLRAWLLFHEAMLISEVVPVRLNYLRMNPLGPRPDFRHVVVDEYQDLNRADQALLDEIARGATFTVVGDEDQSIYSFRYAHREGIADFVHYHAGTTDESLIFCRRCPRRIVEIANSLIHRNVTRSNRVIQTLPGQIDGDVRIAQWRSIEDEIHGLAEHISRRIAAREFGRAMFSS